MWGGWTCFRYREERARYLYNSYLTCAAVCVKLHRIVDVRAIPIPFSQVGWIMGLGRPACDLAWFSRSLCALYAKQIYSTTSY